LSAFFSSLSSATTAISTLSLHDALPISWGPTVVAPWRARRSARLAARGGLVRPEGLTLVEVLVALAVASLLLAVVSAVLGSARADRKSTRLNSSHVKISYAVFCLKKKIP